MRINYPEDTPDKDKFMRCDSDRILLTPTMIHNGVCAGHKMRIVNHVSFVEWIMIQIGMLK